MEARVFIVLSVVLGVLLLGSIVALICVAVASSGSSSSGKYHVRFDHYTAETILLYTEATSFYDNVMKGTMHFHNVTKEYVFGPGEWYHEVRNSSGYVYYRSLSADSGLSLTECEHLLSHYDCYTLSLEDDGSFTIPHEAIYLGEDECELAGLFKSYFPNRTFNKCKSYTLSTDDGVAVTYIIDSETGYPIMKKVFAHDIYSGAYFYITLYRSFNPERPTDKTDFRPIPYTIVYDFRDSNAKTDSGKPDSKGIIQIIKSFVTGLFGSQEKGKSDVEVLFEALKRSKDNDKIVEKMRRNKAIRNFLHIPRIGVPGSQSISIRETRVHGVRDIPTSFDARDNWPNCSDVIGHIKNQAQCGSCWAVSSSSVVEDRLCIANSDNKQELSAQYMIGCLLSGDGCWGAETLGTWTGLMRYGTVPETCVPYLAKDGGCPSLCVTGEPITEEMKVRPGDISSPWVNGTEARVQAIQLEIMTNGPVEAGFFVFDDFKPFLNQHPKGIYQRSSGTVFLGGHMVRIIGWGTEGGVDYWLVANSWGINGPYSGDGGFFKIRRGTNECGIEQRVVAPSFS